MIAKPNVTQLEQLLNSYERGFFSVHESAWRFLLLVDPEIPDLVLSRLPFKLLHEINKISESYDPARMSTWCIFTGENRNPEPDHALDFPNPTLEQVAAARKWIEQHGER